ARGRASPDPPPSHRPGPAWLARAKVTSLMGALLLRLRSLARSPFGLRDEGHRLDLDQDVLAHHLGTKARADRRLAREVFRPDLVHPAVVRRVLQHDHYLEDIIHASARRLDAFADVLERQPGLLLDRGGHLALVVVAADVAQGRRAGDVEVRADQDRARERTRALRHARRIDDRLFHRSCWLLMTRSR